MKQNTKLSVVVPVFFNEQSLHALVSRIRQACESVAPDAWELVFVDDGSGDGSLEMLRQISESCSQTVRIVRMSRNFGSMCAIRAGLQVAQGRCVAVISADLQDPPEIIPRMAELWEQGAQVVLAARKRREDPPFTKMCSALFYGLLKRFAFREFPQGGFDCFLVDRKVVDQINQIQEKNINLMPLLFWLGYERKTIEYDRQEREHGRSRWTLLKKIKLFIDTFVGFSYFPIRLASLLGLLWCAGSLLYLAVVVFSAFFTGSRVPGWASLMFVVLISTGLQMLILGIFGEYLWRTLDESRRRPEYIVMDVSQNNQTSDE